MAPKGILIIGGTRGLGSELVKHYAARQDEAVYATTRSDKAPDGFPESIHWLHKIDLMDSKAAGVLVSEIKTSAPLSTVVGATKPARLRVSGSH